MSYQTESWPRPHRLTVHEYYRMAQVGVLPPNARVELSEGEIIDVAPVGSRHAAVVDQLAKRFILAVGDSATVRIQGPVRLSTTSEPQPDLALLRPKPGGYVSSHPTADDVLLVVEVSDATLRYDRDVKSRLYARYGIAEFWLVDLEHLQVHRFHSPDQHAPHQTEYTEHSLATERLTIPALGIDLDLTRLLS